MLSSIIKINYQHQPYTYCYFHPVDSDFYQISTSTACAAVTYWSDHSTQPDEYSGIKQSLLCCRKSYMSTNFLLTHVVVSPTISFHLHTHSTFISIIFPFVLTHYGKTAEYPRFASQKPSQHFTSSLMHYSTAKFIASRGLQPKRLLYIVLLLLSRQVQKELLLI